MADEYFHVPGDQLRPGAPPPGAPNANDHVRPGQAVPGNPEAGPPPSRQEHLVLLRWCVGLLLVLSCGWGLIFLVGLLGHRWIVGLSFDVACELAAVLSLGLFLLLERNLWLSRFMGLRIGPDSSPIFEAFLLWLLGVPGLLFRSTVDPNATAAPEPSPATEPLLLPRTGSRSKGPPAHTDSFREIVETIVFVIVLVLLLKTFIAEAFVIPTGSMATTLLGYHKKVTCPQCGYSFPVNCSAEADPQNRNPQRVTGCTCENCRLHISFENPDQSLGGFP